MRFTRHRRLMAPVVVAAAVGLTLTACTGDIANDDSATGDCGPYETYGTFDDGTEVNVYGTILDAEADLLNESWVDFENCTGIDIVYEGSDQYEEQLNVRIEGGNPPDLGITPQPGLIARLAQQGDLLPAPKAVADNVAEYWSEDWAAYGTVDDTLYGAPLMANIKGWVWYSPSMFEENGWEVPTTLDELATLTDDIRESGAVDKPWCVGFASGVATGWPGTDWVEDFVLRQQGADVYDEWVAHDIPFNDPKIAEAFDSVGDYIRADDNVNGGLGDVRSIATTDFGDAGLPILDGACALHHQASFYEGFWPEGTTVAEDGDVWAFMLPGTEAGANAVTGGGEIVAAFADSDEVVATQTYLSSPEWANSRVSLGGVISANTGLDPENAGSELLKASVALLQDPNTTFRFDGSDVMPAAVGSGTFWTGMVDWIGGKSTADTLDFIEASWPQE
ncbi:ABC transporter substrate-binding protein [Agromyces sp. H3Y2-19a]|uniref:ABC transporter substrate-binding protein n=1 Tax=Agromyces TaxID=33877 RepID=UPI001E337EC8|nr:MULTISPECIES: ABC transporter substrate-binding protein [Agromyces]MCD5348264.1 ABC transporter substrate-binding protein [Agromyces sp. S2-1-8]MDF0514131.1 ABC transporter substrate-binding protein [Agromyces chromiiresistens]